ncbi:hypothetical protein TNCV_146061 [Trichonephila clavipes]|nr:hypothetical protein TNCV_146061 [Trichonephila clavipes]
MSVNELKNMIFKFEETGELCIIPGTRGQHPLDLQRVQQIDDTIATTSSSSGASECKKCGLDIIFFLVNCA